MLYRYLLKVFHIISHIAKNLNNFGDFLHDFFMTLWVTHSQITTLAVTNVSMQKKTHNFDVLF